MENKHQQILSEMMDLLTSLKSQVEVLESKLVEYQQMIDNQRVEENVECLAAEEIETPVIEEAVASDEPVTEDVATVEEEPEAAAEPEIEDSEVMVEIVDADEEMVEEQQADMFEMEVMDIELEPSDDLPFYDDVPSDEPVSEDLPQPPSSEDQPEEESIEDLPEAESAPIAVIDAMTAKQAWRTDMPGTPVKDIRSAISLNDRILFINYLFGEDPMAFQDMLTKLNAMSSFTEAADHVIAANPDWDLESDTVYRFMMAIRRRLQ